ncbi:hypothetical protein A3726_23020 [Erythrobacter sp. HI0037]|nr:hypothetical protein A3726_23020 [Erythrobacter sp. HI0037]
MPQIIAGKVQRALGKRFGIYPRQRVAVPLPCIANDAQTWLADRVISHAVEMIEDAGLSATGTP